MALTKKVSAYAIWLVYCIKKMEKNKEDNNVNAQIVLENEKYKVTW